MPEHPTQPQFNEQKATEVASIFLQLEGGKMKYIKLLKLLYLADRKALTEWERPITYDSYVNMDKGPVVSTTYDLVKGNFLVSNYWAPLIETKGTFVSLKDDPPKIKKLSRAEIDLVNEISNEFRSMDPFDVADFTHDLPEFEDPHGSSTPIHLADLLTALEFSPEDIERISSELQEEASIAALFGA